MHYFIVKGIYMHNTKGYLFDVIVIHIHVLPFETLGC